MAKCCIGTDLSCAESGSVLDSGTSPPPDPPRRSVSPRKPSSKPAVAVAAVLPEGAPASTAGVAAAELISAAFGLPLPPLDEPEPLSQFAQQSAAAIVTLYEFLAKDMGIAFAEVEQPIAIVQTAINAVRGQVRPVAGGSIVEQLTSRIAQQDEFIRVGREHGQAVRVFLRDHFGIEPEKINTAPLLASAIINQFRALNSELVKAKRGGS